MLLSHYEILACGTALWKLLDLTVFAQGLLINYPLNDGVCPEQTAHVSDERETEREGEESRLDQRGRLPQLYYYLQNQYTQSACSETDSLSFSGWMVLPHHHFLTALNTVPCCHLHLCSFLLHQLPAYCHLIYSGSVGFLLGLTTHFPALVHWPSPQYTHPGSNGL